MKRYSKWTLAAAALTIAAGTAAAETLKAEIPFTFRAGNTVMAAGTYTVNSSGSSPYIMLRNVDTRAAVMLTGYVLADPAPRWKAEGLSKVGFDCAGTSCALRSLWIGNSPTAYRFAAPNLGRDENVRHAEITLTSARSN